MHRPDRPLNETIALQTGDVSAQQDPTLQHTQGSATKQAFWKTMHRPAASLEAATVCPAIRLCNPVAETVKPDSANYLYNISKVS